MHFNFTLSVSNDDGFIYAIINKKSGRRYVGQTASLVFHRWAAHLARLQNGRHDRPGLQKDWNDLGAAGFEWVVLEVVPKDELHSREEYWFHEYIASGVLLYNFTMRQCGWCHSEFNSRSSRNLFCCREHYVLKHSQSGPVDWTLPTGSRSVPVPRGMYKGTKRNPTVDRTLPDGSGGRQV